jgi:hypothetical protein
MQTVDDRQKVDIFIDTNNNYSFLCFVSNKVDRMQCLIDESLERTQTLLADTQQSEITCEHWKEQTRQLQLTNDQLTSVGINRKRTNNYVSCLIKMVNSLKADIEQIQREKQSMSQLQEQVLERIRCDMEMKNESYDNNCMNKKLQQSVDELNVS